MTDKKPTGPQLDALIQGVIESTFGADEAVAKANGTRRDLAKAFNKIWSFDWFDITQPSNDTTDEGKTVRLKQKKLYDGLDKQANARGEKDGYSNKSSVWRMVKQYGREDRYPPTDTDNDGPSKLTHKERAIKHDATQYRSIDNDEKANPADIKYKDGLRQLVIDCYGVDIKDVK